MVVLANRQKERNKVKEDVFNAREDFVELEGIGFFQDGVMYGPDRRRRAACTLCYARKDGVSFIMDGKAFNGRGDMLGEIDENNELVPGTAPVREEAPVEEDEEIEEEGDAADQMDLDLESESEPEPKPKRKARKRKAKQPDDLLE